LPVPAEQSTAPLFTPNVVVIAHSHGGNVAVQATQIAEATNIRLVILGGHF
jgi:hypothetical protein